MVLINIFSGNYNDLTNIPSYSKVAYSGSFYDIDEVPTIFSGNYDDLINNPFYDLDQINFFVLYINKYTFIKVTCVILVKLRFM